MIISAALLIGIYSALHQYTAADNIITATTFIFYSMPVFFFALLTMYIFAVNFKTWGLPYLPTVGMFEPGAGQTPAAGGLAHDPAGSHALLRLYRRLQPLHPQHDAGIHGTGLRPHCQGQRSAPARKSSISTP